MRAHLIFFLPIVASLQTAGSKPVTVQDPVRQKAQTIYDRLQAKLKKSTSLKAVLEIKMHDRVDRYNLSFLRSNFARIVSPEAGIYQDGKTYRVRDVGIDLGGSVLWLAQEQQAQFESYLGRNNGDVDKLIGRINVMLADMEARKRDGRGSAYKPRAG